MQLILNSELENVSGGNLAVVAAVIGGIATVNVQSGMKVDADMLLEQRRIYEWLIEPILSFSKTM
jgi:hypothetical protein